MAGLLITNRELALWSQSTEESIAADPWAQEVIEKFSDYARFKSERDWSLTPAAEGEELVPFDVRMAVLLAAKRTYGNPDSEVSSQIGPIGSRILDEAAIAGAFTEEERKKLERYRPNGDPNGLWTARITRGVEDPLTETLYVGDDQQIGLLESADPREWKIPMFSPGDPGGEG